jgi:kynureninase
MIDLKAARLLDQNDPLKTFKNRFTHQENEIYLDGNSLGKLPKSVLSKLEDTLQNQWGKQLIRSWNENWLELPLRLSKKYETLLNASAGEIVFGESTSVRLYQILFALIESRNYPNQLITDSLNFPTDLYVLQGLAKHFSKLSIQSIQYGQEILADIEQLKEEIQTKPGIICLSLVTYKSAYCYPMKALNEWAAQNKSIIVWDLSHAVGAIPIDFKKTKTKIALGCTYKYMNGGPGSPAFLFVQKELHNLLQNPIQGWFGHLKPFDFDPQYKAAQGLERFNNGTPSILSMQAVEAGVDLILEAGIKNLRAKSVALSEMLIDEITKELETLGFELESPKNSISRGSHIAIAHPHAWQICQALIQGDTLAPKIIPDFRPPHFIRIGITPLYNSYEDLWWLINQLRVIVTSKAYLNFGEAKSQVT